MSLTNPHHNPPLDPRDTAEITRILAPYLEQFDASLVLFGSRARGDARPTSDIDLALKPARGLPPATMAELREQLEESNVPFRVDLVDYSTLSETFKQVIDKEGVPWPM